MKKNVKALIACVAALAVAGGGYAALMLMDDKEESNSSSVSNDENSSISIPVTLFDFEKNDIEYISIKNSQGEYKSIPTKKVEKAEDVELTIQGLEDMDIDSVSISSLLNSSAALNSESTAEEAPSDLEKYGLKNPLAEVTVKGTKEEKTILVGNASPVQGKTYCMEKDGKDVYLAATSSLSVFLRSKEDFISKTILEQPPEDNTPKIKELKIERTDLDYDMVLEYDDSSDDEDSKSGTMATHYMTKPIFAYLDSEKSQTAIKGYFGLSAQSIVKIRPTADEISAAGLDKPFCTITMKTDEPSEYILKLGNKLDSNSGSYYPAMFGDNNIIYAVSPDSVCWAELKPDDITSKMVFGTYVWDIGKLDINTNTGQKVSFEGSGSSEKDYKVTKNGNACDTQRFKSFYQYILKTSAEEFVIDEKTKGEPIVSIKLETQNGKTKQTVEFYQSDGKKALISVNGTPSFKCRMAYVDLLKENLDKFDGSEDFVMNW